MPARAVWLADWSDEEDAALRRAWGPDAPVVLRSTPLGATVGTRLHRLRSYPAYLGLARRGLRDCPPDGVLVAWQPLVGALVGLLRRRGGPALVVLNPLLAEGDRSPRARAVLAGVRRADLVVVYAASAARQAQRLGVPADRLRVVALGVEPRPDVPPPDPTAPLLAAGRDHRDYDLLAEAARRSAQRVLVAGPDVVPAPLEAVHPPDKRAFEDLLAASRALVVVLQDDGRQAGTLAVLDGLAAGRPVLATRGPGTEDYVPDGAGALVPPGDAAALAAALTASADPERLAQWAEGARAAGLQRSLVAFTAAVAQVALEAAAARRA